MPKGKKKCPCGLEWGARKKQCTCGYDFTKQKQNIPEDELIAVGEWVYDIDKGAHKIKRPGPLPPMIDITYLREYITYYGLGDAIYAFVPPEKLKDKKLKDLWTRAREAMRAIHKYVYD
jgi:hypothetical protein